MNSVSHTARVGLFFIFGAAMMWFLYDSLGSGQVASENVYKVEASFSNLLQLKPSDSVRMAGVQVGHVGETRLLGGQGLAILFIDKDVKIPKDSVATIATAGFLGNNYVAIDYGQEVASLPADSRIKTVNTADINQVIAKVGDIGNRVDSFLANLENVIGGEDDNSPGALFKNLNSLIVGNRSKIDATLSSFQDITSKMSNGQGTLGKLINDDSMHASLLSTANEVKAAADNASELFANANGIVANLKEGQGALGVLLYDDAVAGEIKSTVSNIKSFSEKLNSDDNTLGKLISGDELYLEAKGTLNKVNAAVDSMNDSGPITAVGVATNALF